MKHKHHIIPRHAGGSDEDSNIIELSIEDHAAAHKQLFEKYGRWQDEIAYLALSGLITVKEAAFRANQQNGKKQGLLNKLSGHIQKVCRERTREQKLKAAYRSVEVCRKNKKNAFFDPVIRNQSCSLGGKTQGSINATNGHCKDIANKYWQDVKSGKIKRSKFNWITNEVTNIQLSEGNAIPDGFRIGRTIPRRSHNGNTS